MDAQERVCSSGLHHIRTSGWTNSWRNWGGGREGSPCAEGLGTPPAPQGKARSQERQDRRTELGMAAQLCQLCPPSTARAPGARRGWEFPWILQLSLLLRQDHAGRGEHTGDRDTVRTEGAARTLQPILLGQHREQSRDCNGLLSPGSHKPNINNGALAHGIFSTEQPNQWQRGHSGTEPHWCHRH